MHGLNQIHSNNEQAVRDEFNRACQTAVGLGHSYIAFKDELNAIDYNRPIKTFETVSALKAYLLASVKVGDLDALHVAYGRN